MEPALSYVHARGGLALETDYKYLGQNSMCKENKTVKNGAMFKVSILGHA